MTKPFTTQIIGHDVTESIYVKADGRTVCSETDKDVASMAHAKGDRITEAQKARLIFPRPSATEIPDAGERSADTIPDAEKRGGKRK
jgi:hypothetical protein